MPSIGDQGLITIRREHRTPAFREVDGTASENLNETSAEAKSNFNDYSTLNGFHPEDRFKSRLGLRLTFVIGRVAWRIRIHDTLAGSFRT